MNPKRILYILSGNLSTTPRALQSIREAAKSNSVTIIGVNRNNQWMYLDNQLVKEYDLDYKTVSLGREHFFTWLKSSLLHKLCSVIYPILKNSITVSAYASSKVHFLLWSELKKEPGEYDLIIGHSASSLFPVWNFAKQYHIPFIFDVEDYHPGEHILIDAANEKLRRGFLLQKLLPDANYVTIASPLIDVQIKTLIGEKAIKNMIVINNCFPSDEFEFLEPNLSTHRQKETKEEELQQIESYHRYDREQSDELAHQHNNTSTYQKINLVWFSQNIAANRGLEIIIPELAKIKEKVHLHLIGNLYNDFNQQWIEPNRKFITTYLPMPQKELNRFICLFDVGLAIETGKDLNNLIAVSNKIWVYLQAGLYILATDTPAQIGFMKDHEKNGVLLPTDETLRLDNIQAEKVGYIEESIELIIKNIDTIRQHKQERFQNASIFSWEQESTKLQCIWDEVLNK